MVDVVTAARTALPVSSAATVTDNHKLFVTGYSQGGFVAMAAQKAMQALELSKDGAPKAALKAEDVDFIVRVHHSRLRIGRPVGLYKGSSGGRSA